MRNKHSLPMSLLDIVKNGYFQQVRYLVDHGANLNQRDSEKRSVMMLCAFVEPEEWGVGICRLLIERGAILDFKDKYGLNAFHYAVIYERLDLVKVYLNAIDFDLNEKDKFGNTALHYAVKAGNSTITRMIVQTCRKYQLSLDTRNNDRLTALQMAHKAGHRKCTRYLQTPEVLADVTSGEANVQTDLKLNVTSNNADGDHDADAASSVNYSRKTSSRPRSSMLSRRSSRSSLTTMSEFSYRRSPTIYSYDMNRKYTVRKDPDAEILPNEKNKQNIIHCANANDIRNNPEYLFHLAPFEPSYSDSESHTTTKHGTRAKSAFIRRHEVFQTRPRRHNWRSEFRQLYVHYQYQCTASYRDPIAQQNNHLNGSLPALDKAITPANSEHGIDDCSEKGSKKSRLKSASMSRQNTEENLHVKTRQPTKSGNRKISQNVGHGGKMSASMDGSLESSNESINSSVSSKKPPDGKKLSKDTSVGRQSRAASHKTVPSVSVEES